MQPLSEARGITTLAVWVSRVFHPFVISTLVLFLTQVLSAVTIPEALGWTVLTVAVLILPILLFVLLRVRSGCYADIDVSVREDRVLLYGLAGACSVLLIILLAVFDAPRIVQATLRAALFAFGVAAVLNRFVGKISLHMLAMGGCMAVLSFVSLPTGITLGLFSLPLGWSRLYLTRHTFMEVLVGWLVGVICFGSWFSITLVNSVRNV